MLGLIYRYFWSSFCLTGVVPGVVSTKEFISLAPSTDRESSDDSYRS